MSTALKTSLDLDTKKGKNTKEKIENTFTDELIFGICSPIGSLTKPIIDLSKENLKTIYGYDDVFVIKISDLILQHYGKVKELELYEKHTEEYSNLKHKIEGGNFLRKEYNNNSILIELAIKRIREDRLETNSEDILGRRVCYIIDSIKNIEELELLRAVYRDIFYMFSVFSPDKERIDSLHEKGLSKPEAKEIISTDEHEDIEHGQNVRDTFVDGDFFVRSSNSNNKNTILAMEKYLHLIFNSKITTPTSHETAMYFAKSAAGNSSCLSRQVGATIIDVNGVPIAQGWNDVPKAGGNLYRDSHEKTHRCFELGHCTNVIHKEDIFSEIISEIENILPDEQVGTVFKPTKRKKSELAIEIEKVIRNSKFKNIIEYSRSIHAEMHAIVIGSQLTGNKMVGGDLFCTTYPCHNCARHIVLAGIKNIYYIEPYKKSLCLTLHSDSLTENEDDTSKVRILLYDGVAPRRYLEFFSIKNDNRKNKDGTVNNPVLTTIPPKNRLSLQSIPVLEGQAIHALNECGILKI